MAGNGIISSIKDQLDKLKKLVTSYSLTTLAVQQLQKNQDRLQVWYDKLLNNAGILTDDERLALEKDLDSSKKEAMEADAKRSKRKIVYILIGSLIFITGVIIYVRVKKKAK